MFKPTYVNPVTTRGQMDTNTVLHCSLSLPLMTAVHSNVMPVTRVQIKETLKLNACTKLGYAYTLPLYTSHSRMINSANLFRIMHIIQYCSRLAYIAITQFMKRTWFDTPTRRHEKPHEYRCHYKWLCIYHTSTPTST